MEIFGRISDEIITVTSLSIYGREIDKDLIYNVFKFEDKTRLSLQFILFSFGQVAYT